MSDEEARSLGERGFFVRDRFLGDRAARAARRALVTSFDAADFHSTGTGRGDGHHGGDEVRGDQIRWLVEGAAPALARIAARFEELRESINQRAWLGLRRTDVQLSRYPGAGEGYRRHYDAFRGVTSRVCTAICYFNTDWEPADGGELRLLVAPPVDVEPRLDRLVVFLSERVEHEVRPVWAPRFAATAWFYPAD